jgi:hypothetical protein
MVEYSAIFILRRSNFSLLMQIFSDCSSAALTLPDTSLSNLLPCASTLTAIYSRILSQSSSLESYRICYILSKETLFIVAITASFSGNLCAFSALYLSRSSWKVSDASIIGYIFSWSNCPLVFSSTPASICVKESPGRRKVMPVLTSIVDMGT